MPKESKTVEQASYLKRLAAQCCEAVAGLKFAVAAPARMRGVAGGPVQFAAFSLDAHGILDLLGKQLDPVFGAVSLAVAVFLQQFEERGGILLGPGDFVDQVGDKALASGVVVEDAAVAQQIDALAVVEGGNQETGHARRSAVVSAVEAGFGELVGGDLRRVAQGKDFVEENLPFEGVSVGVVEHASDKLQGALFVDFGAEP